MRCFAYFESTGIFFVQFYVRRYIRNGSRFLDCLTGLYIRTYVRTYPRCFLSAELPQYYRNITAVSEVKPYAISSNCDEAIRNFGEQSPKKEFGMPFAEFRIIFFDSYRILKVNLQITIISMYLHLWDLFSRGGLYSRAILVKSGIASG